MPQIVKLVCFLQGIYTVMQIQKKGLLMPPSKNLRLNAKKLCLIYKQINIKISYKIKERFKNIGLSPFIMQFNHTRS